MTNQELQEAIRRQQEKGTTGGTGGAGYTPSDNVNSEIYNINTGGYRNNPNQSYIDFGNSGVLGKEDWLKQNPTMGGYGMPTSAVDSAYNGYLSDFAKQNNINTEGLDLANWESNRDEANAWNDEHSKMSDEELVYSYLQGLVDDGKISQDDATYISRYIYGQDAAGNQIDYAGGWADYSSKKNRGGFTDLYDAYDQADAIIKAYDNGEFKNPSDLYAALDEWTSHHDEDMVTAMIQILDDEFEGKGVRMNLYEDYLPHWYDDVEVTLDGEEAAAVGATPPDETDTPTNEYDAAIKAKNGDLEYEKGQLNISKQMVQQFEIGFIQEILKDHPEYSDAGIDYDNFNRDDIADPNLRAAFDKMSNEAYAAGGDYATWVGNVNTHNDNVGQLERNIWELTGQKDQEKANEAYGANKQTAETISSQLQALDASPRAHVFQRIISDYVKYLESLDDKTALQQFKDSWPRNENTGDYEVNATSLSKDNSFVSWYLGNDIWKKYNVSGSTPAEPITTDTNELSNAYLSATSEESGEKQKTKKEQRIEKNADAYANAHMGDFGLTDYDMLYDLYIRTYYPEYSNLLKNPE